MKYAIVIAGCLALGACGWTGVAIGTASAVYCNGISEPGKQVVRNAITGGSQVIYCEGDKDVQVPAAE